MKSLDINGDEFDEYAAAFDFILPDSYRQFVHRYGAATVGQFSVFGLGVAETMGRMYIQLLR